MSRLNVIVTQPQDEDGRTLPKCEYHSFEVGSNTPKALFSDAALTNPLSNPVIADGAGRFFDIFVASGGYKIELRDQFNKSIWIQDNYFATVDSTDITNLEADITANSEAISENIASYTCTGSADTYVLTIKGGLTAPIQLRQGTKILFTPNINNTGNSTVNVETLGPTGLREADGITTLPSGFLSTANEYMFEFDGSIFRFFTRSGDILVSDLPDLTEGNVLIGDASNRPIEKVLLDWVTLDNSGNLTSGTTYDITGIPSSATKFIMSGFLFQSASADTDANLIVGYGATPTYLTTSGDYLGTTTLVSDLTNSGTDWDALIADFCRFDSSNNSSNFRIEGEKINDGTNDTWSISFYSSYEISGTGNQVRIGGGMINGATLLGDLSALRITIEAGTIAGGFVTTKYYGNANI